jgi:hypothetical protein
MLNVSRRRGFTVTPLYTADVFRRLALAEFPELREEFDEYPELLHLQMAAFARRTQQAKGEADWDTYVRCIRLADTVWRHPDEHLLNALNVSFLEMIDFDGPRGPVAWTYLTPELQHAWRAMQAYLARLATLPHKQKWKDKRR